jgi:hypothetical protein
MGSHFKPPETQRLTHAVTILCLCMADIFTFHRSPTVRSTQSKSRRRMRSLLSELLQRGHLAAC